MQKRIIFPSSVGSTIDLIGGATQIKVGCGRFSCNSENLPITLKNTTHLTCDGVGNFLFHCHKNHFVVSKIGITCFGFNKVSQIGNS